jgi:hypothetical protein
MTQGEFYPQQALDGQVLAKQIMARHAQPSQNWLSLSGKGLLDYWDDTDAPLMQGCFVAEVKLPLPRGEVLLYHSSKGPMPSSFSLFVAPNGEVSLFQRAGKAVLRVGGVACDFEDVPGLRISYQFDAALRRWQLHVLPRGAAAAAAVTLSGHGALPFSPGIMHQICETSERHPAMIWQGFCRQDDLPLSLAWIGGRTPIDTPRGPIAAALLQSGDMILTAEGPRKLRSVRHLAVPARGSFAPVVLRGPYFDKRGDMLVAAQQQIAISGYLVEYLFGRAAVRIAAQDVIDGHTALAGVARDVVKAVCLDLAEPVRLASLEEPPRPGPCRISLILGRAHQMDHLGLPKLTSFETATLLRQMGRIVSKVA